MHQFHHAQAGECRRYYIPLPPRSFRCIGSRFWVRKRLALDSRSCWPRLADISDQSNCESFIQVVRRQPSLAPIHARDDAERLPLPSPVSPRPPFSLTLHVGHSPCAPRNATLHCCASATMLAGSVFPASFDPSLPCFHAHFRREGGRLMGIYPPAVLTRTVMLHDGRMRR